MVLIDLNVLKIRYWESLLYLYISQRTFYFTKNKEKKSPENLCLVPNLKSDLTWF